MTEPYGRRDGVDDARDTDLPGGLERVECAECGHGVITNRANDVDKCVGCRGD
jgi:hypothetical protein